MHKIFKEMLFKLIDYIPNDVIIRINQRLMNKNKEDIIKTWKNLSNDKKLENPPNGTRVYNEYGQWEESTFNKNGKELTYKDSSGYWREKTYDSNGNELTYKNSSGVWHNKTYHENGNLATFANQVCNYFYDSNNNVLYYNYSDKVWQKNTYDSFNNLLTHENSDGYLITNTYNEQGNLLSSIDSLGIWTKINYHPNGFIKSYNDSLSKCPIEIECPVVKYYNDDGSPKITETNDCACDVCQDKL